MAFGDELRSWRVLNSESVRKHYVGLQSFRSMRRMEAKRRKASALRLRHSQSLASLRQRPSQARVRSTIPALGQDDEGLGLIRPLDDLDRHARQSSSDGGLKLRPSIAAVGKEPGQERKGAEQGRHQRRAAVAILDVGGVDDRMHRQALRVDEDVALSARDLLAGVVTRRIDAGPPLPRFDALAVNDRGGRARLASGGFATLHVERVVDAIERAVPTPAIEVIVKRRTRR